jgi:hypothetical protein
MVSLNTVPNEVLINKITNILLLSNIILLKSY